MSKTPRGVRQINENVLQEGRALILTNEDFNQADWDHIPDGTLHVDKETGYISVKLKGQKSWTPAGIRTVDTNAASDVTLVLSRDSEFIDESFTVICADNGNGTFTYENDNGERRTKPIIENKGYVFDLDKGTYIVGRNHLNAVVDGVLTRTVANKGIEELSEKRFVLCDTLEDGQEVSVKYVKWLRVGNPWPRIFLNEGQPETAGKGDFWLDKDGKVGEDEVINKLELNEYINWNRIIGTPTTRKGYGIEDVTEIGHRHVIADIGDFPKSLPANGGDSNTVQGYTLVTDTESGKPKTIVVLDRDADYGGLINENYLPSIDGDKIYGKIKQEVLPEVPTNLLTGTFKTENFTGMVVPLNSIPNNIPPEKITNVPTEKLSDIYIQSNRPNVTKNGSIWFCTDEAIGAHIEVYTGGKWVKFGAVWK